MKKLLSLALVLVLAVSVCGCVARPADTLPSAPTTTAPIPTTGETQPTTVPGTTATQPTTVPTEPATQPTEPATQPTEPATQPTEPATEPTTQPTEPATQPTEPTTQPTEPEPELGSEENPAQLALGENAISPEGEYWFTWVADSDAALVLQFQSNNAWAYKIYNLTAGDELTQRGSSSDEIPSDTVYVNVLKGDELRILIEATDNMAVTATLADSFGTQDNPVTLHVGSTGYLRVPAGATVYFAARAQGTVMQVKGKGAAEIMYDGVAYALSGGRVSIKMPASGGGNAQPLSFSITNQSDAQQLYTITFQVPVGSLENPATLVIGENVATVEKDSNDGYIFHYTATADGVLTITMPSDADWCYSLYNLTSYESTAQFYSSDDPLTASYSMNVKAGDVVQISVCTYNPKRPYKIPAGEVIFTAAFTQN